jgi:hypothetical protein
MARPLHQIISHNVRCVDWRRVRRDNPNSTVVGHADFVIPTIGIVLREVTICTTRSTRWPIVPSRIATDDEGHPLSIGPGARFVAAVEFTTPEAKAWFRKAIEALEARFSDCFDGVTQERIAARQAKEARLARPYGRVGGVMNWPVQANGTGWLGESNPDDRPFADISTNEPHLWQPQSRLSAAQRLRPRC